MKRVDRFKRWMRWVLSIPQLQTELRRWYYSFETQCQLDRRMAERHLRWIYEDAELISGNISRDVARESKSENV